MKFPFVIFSKIFIFPLISLFVKEIIGYQKNVIDRKDLRGKGFIVVVNHINSLDHWIISFALRDRLRSVRFIGALDEPIFWLPSKILYYLANTIPINRKKINRAEFIKKVVPHLEAKKIVVIYPEGTTNRRKFLLRGKTGAVELAIRAGVPVVPMGMRKGRALIGRILEFGEPLYFKVTPPLLKSEKEEDADNFYKFLREKTDKLMREISKLCQKPYPH
ncbi:hypothetical protein BWK69_00825 [Candidatus Parcubacteria bacterium A4]|nr:MAG: hypothetical protein BWK69_00825 [Candidatus Parcubacteria bacterium A4]